MIYVLLGAVGGGCAIGAHALWGWYRSRRDTKKIYEAVDLLVKKRQSRQEARREADRIAKNAVEDQR